MGEHQLIAAHASAPYIGNMIYDEYLELVEARHPFLARMIGVAPGPVLDAYVDMMNHVSWEFETSDNGGRGESYNRAQMVLSNRAEGMTRLLAMFSETGRLPGPDCVILDALAGDGTVSRLATTLPSAPTIISADLSGLMIMACLEQGLPCIRQSASRSLLRDDALDGVLIAYGSHHLSDIERRMAAAEAKRTLRPGGRLVLHDFEIGGGVDAFFRDVVHPFSATGHDYPHFTRQEMEMLLRDAGFRDVAVIDMEDPFVIPGVTEQGARAGMLAHLFHMYGLVKLNVDHPHGRADMERRVADTLGRIHVTGSAGRFEARLRRTALVAVGVA